MNRVTTPKLPPPPRIAQKRSGFSSALARTRSPSASTISAASRLSIVSPHLRVRWPRPPPSVSPPTPVVEMIPLGVARPCSLVAASTSPQVRRRRPRTVRASGSTSTPFSGERSITTPSSHGPEPGAVVAAAADRERQVVLGGEADAAATSSASATCAISAGSPVDHRVVDVARLLVGRVLGSDQLAAEIRTAPGGRPLRVWRSCSRFLLGRLLELRLPTLDPLDAVCHDPT